MNPIDKFYTASVTGDEATWQEAMSESYVGHVNANSIPNREVGLGFVRRLVGAFSDLTYQREDTLVDGNRTVVRWTATGKHTGPLANIEPTNRNVTMRGITIFRIEQNKIEELWSVWDQHDLTQQLTAQISTARE